MSRKQLRIAAIKVAATLPKGSKERKLLLAALGHRTRRASFQDDRAYSDALGEIDESYYDHYDVLVHETYEKCLEMMEEVIEGHSHYRVTDPVEIFEKALKKASRISGAKKALALAHKGGLKPLGEITKILLKAEDLKKDAMSKLHRLD